MGSALVGSRRRRTLLLAATGVALAALLIGLLPLGSAERAQAVARTTTQRCADLVVLGARASGQVLTSTDQQLGTEVHAMALDAARRLDPAVSVRLDGVPYPAVPTSRGADAYDASVRAGVAMLRTRLVRLLRACDRTRVVLAGFSQGAHVVHRTLAEHPLSQRHARRVVAVALIADPTRDGSGRVPQDSYGAAPAAHHGMIGPGPRITGPVAARTLDLCNPADLVCAYPGSGGGIEMAPQAGAAHREFYEAPDVVARHGRWLAEAVQR